MLLASGCKSTCLDDGFAWQQTEECGNASATEGGTDTSTSTAGTTGGGMTTTATTTTMGSASDSETGSGTATTGAPTTYCKDEDGDGQGNPEDCIPADGDPPAGYVPNGDDCDDSDPNTYVGAAEIEDPLACMTDVDDDGWGEPNPGPGVKPGTDCDDNNKFAFPGSAELDDPVACMEDEDGDGYGDVDPPPGVEPGTDCLDSDANTFPGAAEADDPASCMRDQDGDGHGDSMPPDGVTPGDDCDDTNPNTFPGSAPNDSPDACMKDDDMDDWGDVNPPPGVDVGTDCDDSNEFTFPGAAENEVPPGECMRDVDDDGYGDDQPPDGVTPGKDCNDTDSMVFEKCADCAPNEKFCDGQDLNQCNENGTGYKTEATCEFGCDDVNKVCFEMLSVDAGESVCIDKGASAQLMAVAMGGDGNYTWDWTPAATLDNPGVDNPKATPMNATTYTVTVTDGLNSMASDTVSVFIKDQALALSDVECKITNFKWGGAPAVNWNWNPNLVELCQLANSTPTARFCGWSLDNANLQGRFQVKTANDDDYVGFLWGIQPFNQMVEEPKQFYFMSWKQANQLSFCGAMYPQSGQAGILVKRIDVKDPVNAPITCADLHDPNDTANSTVLAKPADFIPAGWLDNIPYVFDLTHKPTDFTLKIIRADNMQVVGEKNFADATYPNGQVGFYAYSQEQACFSNFKTSCL